MPTNEFTLEELRNSPIINEKLQPLIINLVQVTPGFTKPLSSSNGGTGFDYFDEGDLLVGVSPTLTRLPIGTDGQVLMISNTGSPVWSDSLTTTINNFNSNDLNNLYSNFKSLIQALTTDFSNKNIQIFQIEQDISYVINKNLEIQSLLSNNATALADYNTRLSIIVNDINTILSTVSDRYNDLTNTNNNVTSVDISLDNQLNDIANLNTQLVSLQNSIASVSSSVSNYTTFNNLIINGDFQVWNRSESFTGVNVSAYITADHWYHSFNNGTLTSQKQSVIVNNKICNAISLSLTGASTNFNLMTAIEDVRSIQNTTAVLSFYMKCASNIALDLSIIQNFGTSGSSPITIFTQTYNPTSSWVKYTGNVTIPDITSKTIDIDSYISIRFSTASTTFNNLMFAFVKFEEGAAASEFISRPLQLEQDLCKRYYETGYSVFTGRATGNLGVSVTHSYGVTKYRIPDLTVNLVSNNGFLNTPLPGFMNDIECGSIKVTKNNTSGDGSFIANWSATAEII
jgi:hypothetical protein